MPHPLDNGNGDGNSRQEFDSFYGYQLTTNKGHCTISYRNSSNGYYGGNLYLEEDNAPKLGEWSSKNISNWYSIGHLPDWTAYQDRQGSYFSFLKLKAFW